MEAVGPDLAEDRRSEDDTGDQLTDHRRQVDPAHDPTTDPGKGDEDEQLRPEDEELVFVERDQHESALHVDEDRSVIGGRVVFRALTFVAIDQGHPRGIGDGSRGHEQIDS